MPPGHRCRQAAVATADIQQPGGCEIFREQRERTLYRKPHALRTIADARSNSPALGHLVEELPHAPLVQLHTHWVELRVPTGARVRTRQVAQATDPDLPPHHAVVQGDSVSQPCVE